MSLYDLKDLLVRTNNDRGIINLVFTKLNDMTIEDIKKYKDDKEIFNYLFNILNEPRLKENIELLLDYVTDKKIVYRRICGSFNTFKFFVNNLKKEGITLKEIEDSNFKDKLQKQLDSWLEKFCEEEKTNKLDTENINFLLDCGASKKIVYERICENFNTFRSFVESCKYQKEIIDKIKGDKELEKILQEQLRDIQDDIAIQSTGRTVESRDLSRNSTWKPSKY